MRGRGRQEGMDGPHRRGVVSGLACLLAEPNPNRPNRIRIDWSQSRMHAPSVPSRTTRSVRISPPSGWLLPPLLEEAEASSMRSVVVCPRLGPIRLIEWSSVGDQCGARGRGGFLSIDSMDRRGWMSASLCLGASIHGGRGMRKMGQKNARTRAAIRGLFARVGLRATSFLLGAWASYLARLLLPHRIHTSTMHDQSISRCLENHSDHSNQQARDNNSRSRSRSRSRSTGTAASQAFSSAGVSERGAAAASHPSDHSTAARTNQQQQQQPYQQQPYRGHVGPALRSQVCGGASRRLHAHANLYCVTCMHAPLPAAAHPPLSPHPTIHPQKKKDGDDAAGGAQDAKPAVRSSMDWMSAGGPLDLTGDRRRVCVYVYTCVRVCMRAWVSVGWC